MSRAPTELRTLLDTAGLSQRGAARELGLDTRAVSRYCAGGEPVPLVVEYAVRWLVEHRTVEAKP